MSLSVSVYGMRYVQECCGDICVFYMCFVVCMVILSSIGVCVCVCVCVWDAVRTGVLWGYICVLYVFCSLYGDLIINWWLCLCVGCGTYGGVVGGVYICVLWFVMVI